MNLSSKGWGLERGGKREGGLVAPVWVLSPLKPTSCIAPKPNFSTHDDYWVQPLPVTTYFSPLCEHSKIFDFLIPARKKKVTKCMQILRAPWVQKWPLFPQHTHRHETWRLICYVASMWSIYASEEIDSSFSVLRFLHRRFQKTGGVKICEFRTKFLGSRQDPTLFPGENLHMQKTLFWYCTDAQPLTLTSHKRKNPKLSLALHALGAENGTRESPPSKFWLSGPGGPPVPCSNLISWYAHTYSGP